MTDITLTTYPLGIDGKPVGLRELQGWTPTVIDVYPYLGYTTSQLRHISTTGTTLVQPTDGYAIRVHRLVAWLLYYDDTIATSIEDSVATKVGDLEVNYRQQLALLYKRAGEIVVEIGQLVDVPVRYNKYTTNSKATYSIKCPV